jgi:hypothetical protein
MTEWTKLGISSFFLRRTGETSAELRVVSEDELKNMKPDYILDWENDVHKYPDLAPEETCQFAYDGSETGYKKDELKRYHQYLNRIIRITADNKDQCDLLCNGINELLNINYMSWLIGSDDECVCEQIFNAEEANVHYIGSYDLENSFKDLEEKAASYIRDHSVPKVAFWVCINKNDDWGLSETSDMIDERIWGDTGKRKNVDDVPILLQYVLTQSKSSAHLLLW